MFLYRHWCVFPFLLALSLSKTGKENDVTRRGQSLIDDDILDRDPANETEDSTARPDTLEPTQSGTPTLAPTSVKTNAPSRFGTGGDEADLPSAVLTQAPVNLTQQPTQAAIDTRTSRPTPLVNQTMNPTSQTIQATSSPASMNPTNSPIGTPTPSPSKNPPLRTGSDVDTEREDPSDNQAKTSALYRSLDDSLRGYPLLDAMVAAQFQSSVLTLDEMLLVNRCVDTDDVIDPAKAAYTPTEAGAGHDEMFRAQIPNLLEKILASADKNTGRIPEYGKADFILGENYRATVSTATIACFAVESTSDVTTGESVTGAAAYAAHIVTLPDADALFVNSADPTAFNLTLFVEAEVMDLPVTATAFVPKQYCFDFERDFAFGIRLATEDQVPTPSTYRRDISFNLGNDPVSISTVFQRIGFLDSSFEDAGEVYGDDILSAYRNPKSELIGFYDALLAGNCTTGLECAEQACGFAEARGLPCDSSATEPVVIQYNWMWDRLNERKGVIHHKRPFIFDTNLASLDKNSGIAAVQVNPYVKDLLAKLGTSDNDDADLFRCVKDVANEESENSDALNNLAFFLPKALQRRIHEYTGEPKTLIREWGIYADNLLQLLLDFDKPYTDSQSVQWTPKFQELPQMSRGNLTEKRLGQTAEWLAVSGYGSQGLQDLLTKQLESIQPYVNAASDAIVSVDKCKGVGGRDEIFLMILATIVAAFGGVQSVLATVHNVLHWAIPSIGSSRVDRWKRFIPPYELWFAALGAVVFLALHIPAYLQVVFEGEITNYRTSGSDMLVRHGATEILALTYGHPVLITMVHVETFCETARPGLILGIFVGGLVTGVLVNLPFVAIVFTSLANYIRGCWQGHRDIEDGTALFHPELRLVVATTSVARRLAGFCCAKARNDDDTLVDTPIVVEA